MKDEAWFRQRARELYQEEGEIEVDDGALVSIGKGAGAYVQAWVWVDSDEDDADDDLNRSIEHNADTAL